MFQNALKAGLIVALLGIVGEDANAFGRWGGCGCVGYGGYGYSGGWWYPGYGYGGGGYSGYGYGGGSCPGYVYGGWPNSGCTSPVARPNPNTSSALQPASDSVRLTVNVPADAKVTINDLLTTSTGELRNYESKGVQPGYFYRYQVRVEFVRDGKPVREEKTVSLTAGQTISVEFSAGAPEAQVADMVTTGQR